MSPYIPGNLRGSDWQPRKYMTEGADGSQQAHKAPSNHHNVEIEGNIHMINDLTLWVPNVERRCAITCLVIDAQDCLPVRTRLGRSECLCGTCEPAKWKATLRNDNIAWQGHEPHNRLRGRRWMATTVAECMQPPVGQFPGLLFCACGDSPDKSCRAGLWYPCFG